MGSKENSLEINLSLLAKSSFIVLVGIILSKIFTYAYRIIIARQFGLEVYGLFSLAIMVLGFFTAFSALGFNEGMLRYASIYRAKNQMAKIRHLHRISLSILLVSSIIFAIILFIISEWISLTLFRNASLIIFLKSFSLTLPLMMIAYVYLSLLRAYEKIGIYSFIFNILQNLIKFVALIIIIFISTNVNAIIASYLSGIALMAFISYISARKLLPEIFLPASLKNIERKKITSSIFSYSWPLMFYAVIFNIFFWIDSFSIGFFKTAAEVGLYNAAVPIALLLALAPELFAQLFLPLIIKEYSKKNNKLIEELSKQVAKWILIINLPTFALFVLFPETIIRIFFGSDYIIAGTAMMILSFGTLTGSVLIISNNLISMIGKSKLFLFNIMTAALINIVLNFLLVPMEKIWFIENPLGINGAAIATMISVIAFNLMFLIEAKHYLSIILFKRKMFQIFVSALIPFLAVFYLRTLVSPTIISFATLSIFFILAYLFMVIITKGLDKNDLTILKKAKIKLFNR